VNFQKYSDSFLAQTLLPLFPKSVTPNMVSWARVASLPIIWYLVSTQQYVLGFAFFAVAALSDALDGAMARTRDQVTETGKILDAAADRGLIALVALVFILPYFGWTLLAALAASELLNALAAYAARRRLGFNPGANWAGKIKMILQCLGFGAIFIFLISSVPLWLTIAGTFLWVSLVLATLQIFCY